MISLLIGFLRARFSAGLWLGVGVVSLCLGFYAYQTVYQRGYDARDMLAQQDHARATAQTLQRAHDALRTSERLISQKAQKDIAYEQAQAQARAARDRNRALTQRLQHAIAASRVRADAAPGATRAECAAASARDGGLLAAMANAGAELAGDAERLQIKVTALQDEVRFYYTACQAEAAP